MTPDRAAELIREHWGYGTELSPDAEAEIMAAMHPGDGFLDALQRVCGDGYDWRANDGKPRPGSFLSENAVRHFKTVQPKEPAQ